MNTNDIGSVRNTIGLSRIVRWTLGAFFVGAGIAYFNEGGWPAILFGAVFIVTGFFKPVRCIGDNCSLPEQPK